MCVCICNGEHLSICIRISHIYTRIYIYIYAHIYIYIYDYLCVFVVFRVSICPMKWSKNRENWSVVTYYCRYWYTCIYIYAYVNIYMYTRIFICIRVYIKKGMYIHDLFHKARAYFEYIYYYVGIYSRTISHIYLHASIYMHM